MNAPLYSARLRPRDLRAVVAVPACNEADRIEASLAALATQRDLLGAPVPAGAFEILVYANNCTDGTASLAQRFAGVCPHPIRVVSADHSPSEANAGCARKAAMDRAADRLEEARVAHGIILTTDADSLVAPTWFAATLAELQRPVDCVAGYIDALPAEIMRLGPSFVRRGRLEDHYLRLIAELYALCDPQPHDPWPNHRVSSGASLAVTLEAYRAIGGLPALPVGEDAALTRLLEEHGFLVRHSLLVTVGTSCRFDGRAVGGAADTMRLRHTIEDAPCDDDVEPALVVLRRALLRGAMRHVHAGRRVLPPRLVRRLGFDAAAWAGLLAHHAARPYASFWADLTMRSPLLAQRQILTPADLPQQIARAQSFLDQIKPLAVVANGSGPADTRPRPAVRVPAIA